MADDSRDKKLMARALLDAGKDAAKRALEDFTLTDEEKAAREAERERAAKLRKWKWIAIGVGGLLVVMSLFFLLAKLWVYVLILAVVAALGFGLYHYVRPRLGAKLDALTSPALAGSKEPGAARMAESAKVIDVEPISEAPARPVRAPVREEAEQVTAADREKRIDDELAALKAKVGKPS